MLKKKILVVDDDEDIREIMMMVLELAGYEVSGLEFYFCFV